MRTISQLTFETSIQLILQVRMIIFFKTEHKNYINGEQQAVYLGVRFEDLVQSIILSVAHGVLEFVFLYLEAQASETSFLNYCMICFNGRFSWVPYNDYLMQTSQQD